MSRLISLVFRTRGTMYDGISESTAKASSDPSARWSETTFSPRRISTAAAPSSGDVSFSMTLLSRSSS